MVNHPFDFELQPVVQPLADLRIYDHFYSQWWPLDPVISVKVSSRLNLQVDQMTIVLPSPHRHEQKFMNTRIKGNPIELNLNGVYWTGQIVEAVKRHDGQQTIWELTVHSDHKHLHCLPSRVAKGGVSPTTVFKGRLGKAVRYMVANAVGKTGLPTYVRGVRDGREVEITLQPEHSIADVLDPVLSTEQMFVNVYAVHPELAKVNARAWDKKVTYLFAGISEYKWFSQALDQKIYRDVYEQVRLKYVVPGNAWEPHWQWDKQRIQELKNNPGRYIICGVDGRRLRAPIDWAKYTKVWQPLDEKKTREYTAGRDQPHDSVRREDYDFPVYVASEEELRNFTEAARSELSKLPFHVTIMEGFPLKANRVADRREQHSQIIFDNSEIYSRSRDSFLPYSSLTEQEISQYENMTWWYVWWQNDTWYLVPRGYMSTIIYKYHYRSTGQYMPGIMVELFEPRYRGREIIFSTAPGGGIEQWEAKIKAPAAAALTLGFQWDANKLGVLENLSERARHGVNTTEPIEKLTAGDSQLPYVGRALRGRETGVQSVTVDVSPQRKFGAGNVNYSSLAANMDMGKVGTLFYREVFHSAGSGGWSADTATNLENKWVELSGGMSLSLTPSPNKYLFGNDRLTETGWVYGWRPGDIVSFVDGDTTVTEVVSGYEAEWSAANPTPVVRPILGRVENQQSPIDDFVGEVRSVQKLSGVAALAAHSDDIVEVDLELFADPGEFHEHS